MCVKKRAGEGRKLSTVSYKIVSNENEKGTNTLLSPKSLDIDSLGPVYLLLIFLTRAHRGHYV